MATHSSILAWRILWTEEPGGLESMETAGFSGQRTGVSVDNRTLGRLISKTQLSELTSPCKPRTEPTTLKFHPLLLAMRGLFEMFVGQNPIMLKMAPSSGPQALGWPTLLGATLKAMAGSAAVCGQWPSEAACRPRGCLFYLIGVSPPLPTRRYTS